MTDDRLSPDIVKWGPTVTVPADLIGETMFVGDVPVRFDAPPPQRCERGECTRLAVVQVLYRTARNAPPGNRGDAPRYVLSERMCRPHGVAHAEHVGNRGFDAVTVLDL